MQLYKIHTYYVVANSLEQAKEAVKDNLPETYFSESVCPVHVVAVEQPRALDFCPECLNTGYRRVSPTILAKCSCEHGQSQ